MKTLFNFLLILSTIHSLSIEAQVRKKIYRIRVEVEGGVRIKGHLIALQDSGIQILMAGRQTVDTIVSVERIRSLSLRRRNAPGRRFAIGMGLGGAVGVLIGYAGYSDPDCDTGLCIDIAPGLGPVGGSILGGLTGSVVGLVGGLKFKKFRIDGEMGAYQEFKQEILNGPQSTLILARLTTVDNSPLTTHPNIPQTALSTARVFPGLSTPPDRGEFP
jgi:hypothetical protein